MKLFYLNFKKPKIMLAVLLLLSSFQFYGQTNPTPQNLPFSQDFSGLLASSTTYPAGIQGWSNGVAITTSFRTNTPSADLPLSASGDASKTGNQCWNFNGKIGYLSTGAATGDLSVALAINTTGLSNIQVNYNVMTIRNTYDGVNTRIIENGLQYRIGTSGNFTNVTGVAYQTNTVTQISAITTPQNQQPRSIILPAACNNQAVVQLRWVSRDVSGTGTGRPSIAIDDINIVSLAPVISTSGSLAGLTTTYGTPSSTTSFSFSASYLTANVTLTAPAGFEISTTETSGYSTSLSIPNSGGTISSTTVYVRLAATTAAGSYSGNIALTSGSTSVNVATVLSTVNQKELTISGISIADKNFDGNALATITGTAVLNGLQNSDAITLGGSPIATFNDATVGNSKPVAISGYAISGTNQSSYFLTQPSGLTGNILSSGLSDQTITFNALSSVTYGDASFTLNASSDSGLPVSYSSSNTAVATVVGNTVTIVGAGTTTISASQEGDASYNPAIPVNQNLVVSQKQLTISGAVAADKTYNGNTVASISGGSLNGVIGLDDVAFSGTGVFDSPNVGTDKTVTGNLTLTGLNANNYTLVQPTLFADISAKELTITGVSIANKVFDNNTSATIVGTPALSGVVASDVSNVQLGGTPLALFDDAAVGNTKNVTVSGYTISGTASTNYILLQPQGLTANISLRSLNITGLTAEGKVYDRTNSANITGTPVLTGLISGDENNVNLDGVAVGSFDTFNVGVNKTVTVTGFSISGVSASNYSLSPLSLQASITAKELTIENASVNNKTYDGTVTATLNGNLQGVISPDDVVLNLSGNFNSATVGQAKPVTSTSTLTGLNTGNYILIQPTGLTADILAELCSANSGVVNWNFTSGVATGATPSLTVSKINVSNLSGGQTNGTTNFIANSTSSTGYAGASGTFNASVAAFVGTLNIGTSTYYEFTITPDNGYVYTFSSISFGTRSSGSGPKLYSLRSSLDGYSTDLVSGVLPNDSTWHLYTSSLTLAANQSGPITFRLYGSNGTGTPGAGVSNWRIDDINLNITASPGNALSSSLSATACSDSNFSYTPTTNYTGATITWTRAAVAGISNEAITTPQSSNPNENLVNTTTSPIDVIYTFTVTNSTCYVTQDVVVTVYPTSMTTAHIACESYFWPSSGQTYTTSGSYNAVSNIAGCTINETLNLTIETPVTLFQDFDGDGYGNAAVSVVGCSQSGYVTNNTDCDDTIFAVNPGVVEVLYDGVDNNCNGVMDEGYQITANMVNCGTTLSTLSSFIYCVSTPGVNGYRFEVTNTTTNQVQTIDRPTQYFSLTQLSSYDYATTYSVRVMVRKSSNNVWLGYYGPACLYSTPPVVAPTGGTGTTQLQTYCGETLPTISTIISTTSLAGATGYRFRVTNTTTGAVQTLTRTLHWFSLTMLSSYNYGTTYAVDVAVKTTGDYSDYGAPCNVTTPAVPTLVNYCGGAVVPTKGTQIRTSSLDKVTAYEFTVDRYNASLELVSSSVVVKSLNRFTFNDITNYAAATTYSVRVRVFTAGSWSPYGDACEILSPGAAKQGDTKAVDSSLFSVVAYPNPYDYQFSFRMESSSDAPVHVKVYDMIGKLIETREINAADMSVVSLGERYPSGVYNVVVTQEENVKTLRLVKR